jgi:dTMP kinase
MDRRNAVWSQNVFITFEGPEGSGKTTQVRLLSQYLTGRGLNVLQLREPGSTPIGDQIRDVLHDMKNQAMDARAELLLYSASRAQLVAQVIRPHLDAGGIVITDRFADSTMAYQGYGHGLDLNVLRQITQFATGGLKPDLTLYLDLDPSDGLARRNNNNEEWNRMDALALDFHRRVREGYDKLLAAEPERWVRIDANQTIDAVHEAIRAVVEERLSQQKA